MEVTARIFKNNGEGKFKARAEITLGGEFVARGFRVMEGERGLFVAFPQGQKYQKDGKDVYPDQFFPITAESREKVVKAILDAYNEEA